MARTRELLAAARLQLARLQAPELWAERASLEYHVEELEAQLVDRPLKVEKSMLTEYDAVYKIKDMVTSYAVLPLWMNPQDDGPNPFYGQTFSGLFLLNSTCAPSTLWTPWGRLELGGSSSGDWGDATREILVRLGAGMYRAGGDCDSNVYGLSKVDDLPLPAAVERPLVDHAGYKVAKNAWSRGVLPEPGALGSVPK